MKYSKSERLSYGVVGVLCIGIGYAFNVQGLNVVSENIGLQWGLPLLITALQFAYSYSRAKPGVLLTVAAIASYVIGIFWNAIGIADVSNFEAALGQWSFWVGGTIILLMAALIDLVAEPSLHIAFYGEEGNDIFNAIVSALKPRQTSKPAASTVFPKTAPTPSPKTTTAVQPKNSPVTMPPPTTPYYRPKE